MPGTRLESFGAGRLALRCGAQKIDLHAAGREFEPKATVPTPGPLDLCFLCERPLDEVAARLGALGSPIVEGPLERTGAVGPMRSVYVRDPDGSSPSRSAPASNLDNASSPT